MQPRGLELFVGNAVHANSADRHGSLPELHAADPLAVFGTSLTVQQHPKKAIERRRGEANRLLTREWSDPRKSAFIR